MITLTGIEPIQCDHNVLYCVGYTTGAPDNLNYTDIELAQLLRHIERTRAVQGVKVQIDEEHSEHIVNYLENNIELLLTEMIENEKAN